MTLRNVFKLIMPEPIIDIYRYFKRKLSNKHDAELASWRIWYNKENGFFRRLDRYELLMLAMAGKTTDDFLKGKVVADFGCGPRGSLIWASSASLRIGIDVLSDRYADEFTESILSHGMIYLKCTEKVIPLPTSFVDIMFTLNAMDHVDNFAIICNEIIRVLKPGGQFIGSFNIGNPPTIEEPQTLTERAIKENLLSKLYVQSYRLTVAGPKDDLYAPFFDSKLTYLPGQPGILWVKAQKYI